MNYSNHVLWEKILTIRMYYNCRDVVSVVGALSQALIVFCLRIWHKPGMSGQSAIIF